MPKKAIFLLVILCFAVRAKAQNADTVYNRYLDFNLKRLKGNTSTALKLGESILPNVKLLPDKSRISFYASLAKLYEDDNQSVEAIPLYEMVVAAQPNYYVAHRALGYLYLKPADELYTKRQANANDNEIAELYKASVQKALPHLEKAQACDPSDETMTLIKKLYTNIHDDTSLKSLDKRLAALSKDCIDILSD
jgi:tetratricopeptide (TPR) repeat protein